MKKYLLKVFVLLFITSCVIKADANHLLGGQIGYTYISTNGNTQTYKVTLSFFADCSSANLTTAFAALNGATPYVKLYNGSTMVSSTHLVMNDSLSDIDITPVCPDEADSTTCVNPSYPIPGIKQYVYEGTFQLEGTSANWRFAFEGDVSQTPLLTQAGRSNIITNANVLGGSSIMYLYATLDNTNGVNSSPEFTSLPTPFFCINKPQNYSLGAVDPDGDAMTFGLIPAQQLVTTNTPPPSNITYNSPYTATAPLPTAPGDFSFNTTNGQMTFTPNLVMNCVVVNSVNEYRDNELVGTSMREMTFVILDNCNNDAPIGPISNTENVTIVDSNGQQMFQVCAGQTALVTYDINSTDPNGDNITVTWNNLPTGAAITVDNNGTTNPVIHFMWNVVNAVEGNYTFYVTYTDDGCPLASTQTLAYTIQVVPFPEEFTSGFVEPCIGINNGKLWIAPTNNTGIEYTYYWYDNNNVIIQQASGTEGDTLFNAAPNVYAVKIVNPDGCRKTYQLNIPTPNYGITLNYTDTVACTNAVISFGANATGSITSWTWNFGDGSPEVQDMQIASHAYTDSGNYTVTLTGYTDNGCSDTDYVNVSIDEPQPLTLVSDKDSVCIGERIHFTATTGNNADSMNWNFGNDWIRTPAEQNEVSYVYDTAGIYPIMLSTSYHYCPDENATDTIWVFPYPTVNLGADTTLCDNGEPIALHNHAAQPLSYTNLWSTGDTTSYLIVNNPGIYSLTVASDVNCKTTDEIKIRKDCYIDIPNSFSPNGDGINDYFFPRNLLSSGVTKFSMQVYDRWGEKVFDTDNVDGRGWDGRFNGKEQPVGVYVYTIDVTINGERQEKYNGNVSLLR